MSDHRIECTVNGEAVSVEHVPARRLLSDFLRDDLTLTGTKRGCETGICGACSVLVDGEVVKSCLMLAVQVQGRDIRTVEGLAQGEQLHPLQESFMQCGGLQCGYCTPGFLMATAVLIERLRKSPVSRGQLNSVVAEAIGQHVCRCTGYVRYHAAVRSVILATPGLLR